MIWPLTAKDVVAKVSGLEQLNPEDRTRLIQHNFPAITIFIQAVVMENRQDFKGYARSLRFFTMLRFRIIASKQYLK
jgi:hypothetical protein